MNPNDQTPPAVPTGGALSPWTPAALIASFVPCPPMCFLGVLFGVLALRDGRRRGRRGRGAAIAAIVVGAGISVFWIVAAVWWNANVRRPMIDGPAAAFRLGLAGDVEGFRAAFHRPGPAAEAASFLETLSVRHGPLRAITREPRGPARAAKDIDPARLVIPYLFHFDGRSVPAEAQFIVTEGGTLPFVLKWGWVRVGSPEDHLIYPVAAAPPPASDSSQAPDAAETD